MSADNWAVCPRCVARARAAEATQLAAVMESYGNVPVEEFDRARAEVKPVRPQQFVTFREDYNIWGAADGVVKVSYEGACSGCALYLTFSHEHPLPVEE